MPNIREIHRASKFTSFLRFCSENHKNYVHTEKLQFRHFFNNIMVIFFVKGFDVFSDVFSDSKKNLATKL